MKISKKINSEDVTVGDLIFEGEVVRVTDNYDSVDCVDIYVEGEDDPLTYRLDDVVEIFLDVA